MTEIQLIGSKYAIHTLEAKILPERLLLNDMLQNVGGSYFPIEETDFEQRLKECIETRQRIV